MSLIIDFLMAVPLVGPHVPHYSVPNGCASGAATCPSL